MDDFDKILKFWGPVEADYDGCGNLVLTRLFIAHPHTQKLFPKLAKVPQNELASHKGVSDIGGLVLKNLGEMLNAKGNHADIIKRLADIHGKKNHVPVYNFELVGKLLREIMVEKFGMDEPGERALKNVMNVVVTDMEAAYKALGVNP